MFKKIWGRHDYLTRENWNTNSHVEKNYITLRCHEYLQFEREKNVTSWIFFIKKGVI